MNFIALRALQTLYRSANNRAFASWLGSSANYSRGITNVSQLGIQKTSSFLSNSRTAFSLARGHKMIISSAVAAEFPVFSHDITIRLVTTQAKAPPQVRQMGALKVSMLSPGFIYEPYSPRQPIPFWQRWFTRSGWRRTKDDIILELKSAYAIAKLRKKGYSKKQFYEEAVNLYKEINTLIANGDKTSLRKAVTENMYSALKNEIKLRESKWNKVYWEMIVPVVKIRTLRARLIGVDRSDLEKVFVQLTLEILAKQKFEAYSSEGAVVAGDKSKEVLVRDIWVFEKSLFHEGAFWRLCGRIPT
ncbi:uncharacterized protein LOC120071330 isoform X1 [Benincasa hispida]|uniref:uncharacterized protein LOC120071330 isoform X1 n=2 Tax=Benincasa hispida TaxID=102211 RepID=UPI001901AE75|nr:uncharacterized protein LOC120071330 isoform X1 [Benincasa hispida]